MIEKLIISRLLRDEAFARKALPNLKTEYFRSGDPTRVAFELIDGYIKKYVQLPSTEAMIIELQNRTDLNEDLYKESISFLEAVVNDDSDVQYAWLVDQAEQFCQDKAIHLALSKSLEILHDKGEKGLSRGSIPKLLQDALSVTFDPSVGHDYIKDADLRYDHYTKHEKKIPFDLRCMNEITRGGWSPKTLNVVMAVSGAGKSLFMCHCAAANMMMGKNVLYITLELSQEMVAQRIDANLLGVDMSLLANLPRLVYKKKIEEIRSKTAGNLIVKEYSAGGASHFRHLLNELKMKKGFTPDVIYVDYLNLCTPTGRKGEMNSYERVKCVAEELRAIGVDYDLPIVTATQTNRSGYGSSGVGMENVSDSLGLPMTADLFFALIETDQLKELGQYMVKQLKSRYDDIGKKPTFYLGVRKPTMFLFDLEDHGYRSPDVEQAEIDKMASMFKGNIPDFNGFH